MRMPTECDGEGVRRDGEPCPGCPRCGYAAKTAEAVPIGMGVSRIPAVQIPNRTSLAPIDLRGVRKLEEAIGAIRQGASNDMRPREQVALGLGEEAGSLLREVLKHEGSDGAVHRDRPQKAHLAEEISDVVICLFTIAEKYRVTDSELVQALRLRIKQWQKDVGAPEGHESDD